MSYTPTTWATGDVITAEKLNNMENGIANAGSGTSAGNAVVFEFTAAQDPESYGNYIITTDVTFEEVKSAMLAGKLCVAHIVIGQDDIRAIVLSSKGMYDVNGIMIRMGLGGGGNNYLNVTYYNFFGDEWSGWRYTVTDFNVALSNG